MTVSELIVELEKQPPDAIVGWWRGYMGRLAFNTIEQIGVEVVAARVYVGISFSGKPETEIAVKDLPEHFKG